MPRAIDFKQPTADYDPTRSGTEFHIADLFKDLAELIQSIIDGFAANLSPLIISVIEDLTGIDLSAIKPLLDDLHLDFSSPAALITSLVNAVIALPEILVVLLTSLIDALLSLDGAELLNSLLTELITLLASLPDLLGSLLTALVDLLTSVTGVDLSALLPMFTGLDLSDPVSFLTSLAEGLLAIDAVIASFIEQLFPWLDIEGSKFLNGALDGINLEPGAVARMIRDAIGDALEDTPLLGEITQPLTGLVGQIDTLETHFTNLRTAIAADLDELNQTIGDFDPAAMIDRLIEDRIKPLQKLAELVGGFLPDSQKPQWLQDVTDNIHNAYTNLGDPLDINLDAPSVLDAIFGVFSTGLGASTHASELDARILALESAGHTISIDFAGASSTSLGSDWDVSFSGGGGGSMGLDGKGNLVWKPSGAGSRIEVGRYTATALTTNNGVIETILSSSPQSPIFDDAFTYINFRMNTAKTTYTRLRIGYGTVRLQAVVTGVITNISADASVSPKAGDRLRVAFGEPAGANPLHFVISLGGTTILDFTDSGTAQYGPSYLYIGAGMETGNRLIISQNIPSGLGVLTAAEVL